MQYDDEKHLMIFTYWNMNVANVHKIPPHFSVAIHWKKMHPEHIGCIYISMITW